MVFSLLKRFLEHEGYEATFVANVTDVNDKIYDAARERGVPSTELAHEMTAAYLEDTGALGLGRPDHEPRATETIGPIIALIEDLVAGGHAYECRGDVYFRVARFEGYGKLSNRPLEEMHQGEGDDATELKESPQDFALWKARKEDEDSFWESPWGPGRPGWHIECSAMAEQLLGVDFEIHGGGSDLVFPHHENEIAQTEAARGQPLARLWMHNGMVALGAEKMAKSVGNIRLLHAALEQFGHEAFLMWMWARTTESPWSTPRTRSRRPPARWRACGSWCAGSIARRRPRRSSTRWPRLSSTTWPTTSTPPLRALCCSTGWPRPIAAPTPASGWVRAASGRCSTSSASRACSMPRTSRRPPSSSSWPRSATRRAPRATSSAPTGCATSWRSAAGRSATPLKEHA